MYNHNIVILFALGYFGLKTKNIHYCDLRGKLLDSYVSHYLKKRSLFSNAESRQTGIL